MKKIFLLSSETEKTDRHVEAIRREINKYIARERKKKIPDDFDQWSFDCKMGASEESAEKVDVSEIATKITSFVEKEMGSFFVEILAKPEMRKSKK